MPYKDKKVRAAYIKKYQADHPDPEGVRARVKKYWQNGGKEKRAERTKKNRQELSDYKASQGCLVCGEKDPVVLDLHHLDPLTKIGTASQFIQWGLITKARAEKDKCVVLCANDHRRITKGTINIEDYLK